jgi:hypothetical protein
MPAGRREKMLFGKGEGGALRGVDRPSVRIVRSVLREEGRVRSAVTGTLREDRRLGVPSSPGAVKMGGTPYCLTSGLHHKHNPLRSLESIDRFGRQHSALFLQSPAVSGIFPHVLPSPDPGGKINRVESF